VKDISFLACTIDLSRTVSRYIGLRLTKIHFAGLDTIKTVDGPARWSITEISVELHMIFMNKRICIVFSLLALITLFPTQLSYVLAVTPPSMKTNGPSIIFPSEKEMMTYLQQVGRFNNNLVDLSNSSNKELFANASGNASDIQSATVPGTSFVAFLSESVNNKTNYVYLSITGDLLNHFQGPLRLSTPAGGNASHIQIAANGSNAFVVWAEKSLTTHINSIWASSSMDSGNTWRTWRVNLGPLNAIEPSVTPSGIIFWLQQVNPNGQAPSNIQQSMGSPAKGSNSTSSDPVYHPYGHCCW
jgi:hypothetical protein